MDMKNELIKIFKKNLNIDSQKVDSITMKNTEKWDSFTHINLILEIEEKFKLKRIKPENIAKLTSFKKCFEYLNKNSIK